MDFVCDAFFTVDLLILLVLVILERKIVDALQLVHLCCASDVIAEIVFMALNGLVVDLGHIKLCFAFIEL